MVDYESEDEFVIRHVQSRVDGVICAYSVIGLLCVLAAMLAAFFSIK